MVTVEFFVPTDTDFESFLCAIIGFRCGSSAYGDTFIGFCAFEANSSCGGSGNPESDRTVLPIIFRGAVNTPPSDSHRPGQ